MPIVSIQRPKRPVFEAQMETVHQWCELRAERLQEIITQIGIPLQYWTSVVDLNPTTHPFTLQFLHLGLAFASYVNQPIKHILACPRPTAYSSAVQPVINPRRFAAFPSGHATEAFLVARLLQRVMGVSSHIISEAGKQEITPVELQLQRLATRIANNRVVAGVHFPVDATAGRMVAETLVEYLIARSESAPATEKSPASHWYSRGFLGHKFEDNHLLFRPEEPLSEKQGVPHFSPSERQDLPSTQSGNFSGILHFVWKKAREEWGGNA